MRAVHTNEKQALPKKRKMLVCVPTKTKKKMVYHTVLNRGLFRDLSPTQADIEELHVQSYQFMGKMTHRKVGFFDELGGNLVYTYAGKKHKAKPFTPWLAKLAKALREHLPTARFNCVNINFYPLGSSGSLVRHQDDEPCHNTENIYSISFGSSANMMLYEGKKGRYVKRIQLNDGDLLIFNRMAWHSIGSSKQVKTVSHRLNLTFRSFRTQ